jgi:2-hydroxychromene-2-carboxylate isomerase
MRCFVTHMDVYISLNSPWTYLGWQRVRALRERYQLTITVKPARFTDVFAATGGLPLPKRAPERRAYRMMELKRWRDRLGLPIALEPKSFPSDEAPGVRLLIAATAQGHDGVRLAEEIGKALWEMEQSIAQPEVLSAAAKRADIDAHAVLAKAASAADLDATWDANTTQAVKRGVFGAPSYVLPDGEIFWGQDRLELLEWRLSKRACT